MSDESEMTYLSLDLTVRNEDRILGTITEKNEISVDWDSLGKLSWAITLLAMRIIVGAIWTFDKPD